MSSSNLSRCLLLAGLVGTASAQIPFSWIPIGNLPGTARTQGVILHDPSSLLIHGGFDPSGAVLGTWQSGSGTSFGTPFPGPVLADHAGARLTTGALMFGGFDGTRLRGETVDVLGAVVATTGPSPRRGHGITTADSQRTEMLLFGGFDGTSELGDTWLWSNGAWTRLSPVNSPPARRDHMMATHPVFGPVIFGGRSGSQILADTWAWTGTNWRRVGVSGPAARFDGGMTAYSGQVILAGGNGQVGPLDDAWILDRTGWVEAPFARLPVSTGGHLLGPVNGRLVATGGSPDLGSFALRNPLNRAVVQAFGSACPGTLGETKLEPVGESFPRIGGSFDLRVTPVLGGRVLFGVLGSSDQFAGGVPLPISLAPFGAPGCEQFVSIDSVTELANLGGFGLWSIPIPNVPTLSQRPFYLQAVVGDPAANAAGIVVTQAFECVADILPPVASGDIVEEFQNDMFLDRMVSSGTWSSGAGTFAQLGGTGRHGRFEPRIGAPLEGNVFEWNTDSFVIPARLTISGQQEVVTDGVFEFTEFVVPAGVTVRFVGSNPAVIRVAGRVLIEGVVDASGAQTDDEFNGVVMGTANGAVGGPGGAAGGSGGEAGDGVANQPAFSGQDGGDVVVPAGHAYVGQRLGTGGQGSLQFPADGRNSSIIFNAFITSMRAGGGGGGGYVGVGNDGDHPPRGVAPSLLGPVGAGGVSFDILGALTRPAGVSSLDFYAVGGSGGGGSGSHPMFTNQFVTLWARGTGGTGGGGAIVFRVGDRVEVDASGSMLVRGGDAFQFTNPIITTRTPAPGGAGSGGSLLLQCDGSVDVDGALDVSGGAGGVVSGSAGTLLAEILGGEGAPGVIRIETPSPIAPGTVGGAQPALTAANVGALQDEDRFAVMQSRPYPAGVAFPTYSSYAIDLDLNGNPLQLTDGTPPGTAPMSVQFQAVEVNPVTGAPTGRVAPWRDFLDPTFGATPSLDGLNAIRFRLVVDRNFGTVVVRRVEMRLMR